ncbi:acyl-CoA dehydrogenase family protein [Nocardia sp. NPDC005745]|uniref:acyl-CoA dehydrogenase family protein n=1 Tax=Nocardia sp. NPDC005745 TaxID=3157061 RepID=UPI0034041B4D
MTNDLDQLRDFTDRSLGSELAPDQHRWPHQHAVDRAFWKTAGAVGLLRLACPEQYGGVGGTVAHEAVVVEEQANIADDCWSYKVHSTIVAHYLNAYGTEEKKRWRPPGMARGDLVGATANSPATSDADGAPATVCPTTKEPPMPPLTLGHKTYEQFSSRELVELGDLAEEHGSDSPTVSDHFQPWRHQEHPIASIWRDVRIQRIYDGANEVMTDLIGRAPVASAGVER